MDLHLLFNHLDLDGDGVISRAELHRAALLMGWHWREAPLLAVLDRLCLANPISFSAFERYTSQLHADPLGPYGEVLRNAVFSDPSGFPPENYSSGVSVFEPGDDGFTVLERYANRRVAEGYACLLERFPVLSLSVETSAALIIDPQHAFTRGVWMQSIGQDAEVDVCMIAHAFANAAHWWCHAVPSGGRMATRCPFPPGSYDWDARMAAVLDASQPYFIKPGNSVLFPPANGFREWVDACLRRGISSLVMGGCTLTSCVRVSAIETMRRFASRGLTVVVDLSLCGARLRNYFASPLFDGLSPVASAIAQLQTAGVKVARATFFSPPSSQSS